VGAAVLFAGLVISALPTQQTKAGEGTSLKPELRATVQLRGTEPVLEVLIKNETAQSFWVNKRFAWNSESAPEWARELTIEIKDSSGQLAPYSCKMNIGLAGRTNYILLYPGEFVGRTISLKCAFLKRGAHYSIVARFRDSNTPQGLPPNIPVLHDELVSNTLELDY